MFDIRRTFLFYLDTKYKSGGTLTSPIFNFPNNLIGVENDERIKLTLQEMTMPYTFYQTENYNNKFLLTENGINRLIEIEIGNYNIVTFIFELTNISYSISVYHLSFPFLPIIDPISFIDVTILVYHLTFTSFTTMYIIPTCIFIFRLDFYI